MSIVLLIAVLVQAAVIVWLVRQRRNERKLYQADLDQQADETWRIAITEAAEVYKNLTGAHDCNYLRALRQGYKDFQFEVLLQAHEVEVVEEEEEHEWARTA